jgi:serine phosphatase RsbU (regulator of sigma subunit)
LLLGIIVGVVITGSAAYELGNPLIRNYLPEEYQGRTQSWSIAQDNRGLVYFANNKGVMAFDGCNWSFTPSSNNSSIRSLAIHPDGTIYSGANGDFGYLAMDVTGKWTFISLKNKLKSEDQNFSDIMDCQVTSDGVYFIAGEKIFYWNGRIMKTIVLHGPTYRAFVIQDTLYFINGKDAICTMDKDRPCPIPQSRNFVNQDNGRTIILPANQANTLLVVTSKRGLFYFHLKIEDEQKAWQYFPTEITDFLLENIMYRGIVTQSQTYIFSTQRGGIVMMNNQGKLLQIINKNRGLSDNSVWALLLDRENNLWAATNNGMAYIQINSPISRFSELNGLDGTLMSVVRLHDQLYVGSFNGTFYLKKYHIDVKNDKQEFLPVKGIKINCLDLFPFKGSIIASGDAGHYQIYKNNSILLKKGNYSYAFGYSPKFPDYVFSGTMNGLVALEIVSDTDQSKMTADWPHPLQCISSHEYPQFKDTIRKITSDGQGDLWLSTEFNGILYLKFKNQQVADVEITRFTTDHGLPDLNHNKVNYINQQIVAATLKGIYQAVQTTSGIKGQPEFSFVPEKTFGRKFFEEGIAVNHIFPYKNNQFIFTSSKGMGIISKDTFGAYCWDFNPFKVIKGSLESLLVEENGDIWICDTEMRCLFRYDGTIHKEYKSSYHALVSRVLTDRGNELFAGDYYDVSVKVNNYFTKTSLKQPEKLKYRLPFTKNSLMFHFAAAYYENGDDNRFSYQLKGYDKTWTDWSKKNEKEYTNLAEGSYSFQVKGRNVYDQDSSIAAFEFLIAAPWYRTLAAYLGYLLLFLLSFWGAIQLKNRRLIAANLRLEKIVTERTAEIVRQKDEISNKNIEITKQKLEIEANASALYETNSKLTETNLQLENTKNALWGEMALAKKIQTVLLPRNPIIPGYEIAAFMQPADEVGGDYYDVIEAKGEWLVPEGITPRWGEMDGGWWLDSERAEEKDGDPCRGGACPRPHDSGQPPKTPPTDPSNPKSGQPQGFAPTDILATNHYPLTTASKPTYWLVIGDVSGHGVSAGLVMMMVQTAIHTALKEKSQESPAKILSWINSIIHENIQKMAEDKYMTITLLSIQDNGRFLFSGLHQDIIIYRADKNKVELLETNGMWLGMTNDIRSMLQVEQFVLNPNDAMLLYTDGIPEAVNANQEMFTLENLANVFSRYGHESVEQIKKRILQSIETYTTLDDITFMVIKRKP